MPLKFNENKKIITKEEKAELKAQIAEIKQQRKNLKKDLKLSGIKVTGDQDFEFFAREVGLSYPDGTIESFLSKTKSRALGVGNWVRRTLSAQTIIIIILILLASLFIIAYISEEKGHFTINITADMMKNGFELSTDQDFSTVETRLFADEVQNSNATSIYEMNRGIASKDGSNNGPGYMGYSFYIKNNGEENTSYAYTVNILSQTLGADKAAWLMFFEDDKQIMYARAQEDGSPEVLWGYPSAPFGESAYDYNSQYFYEDGKYGIKTTPFLDENTALQGFVENFEPGEVKRYTIVAWLEGDDPDCNNSILGGHCGFNIQFDRIGKEDTSYFKGLFRTEYDKSYYIEPVDDTSHERDEHDARQKEE